MKNNNENGQNHYCHFVLTLQNRYINGTPPLFTLCMYSYFLKSWSNGNQCLSQLKLWVRISLMARFRCTTLCGKVCQWLATGRWFSPATPVFPFNKTDSHDITDILLKVALSTITLTHFMKKVLEICLRRGLLVLMWYIEIYSSINGTAEGLVCTASVVDCTRQAIETMLYFFYPGWHRD